MQRLTESQIQEIITRYKNGDTPSNIGKDFDIYDNSVTRILRKRGIERNQHSEKVSDDNIKLIIEKYNNKISAEKIAKELGINASTVCRILKRNGVELRNASDRLRKHDLNENFFENIDSEQKAYFLGYLYADGTISSKRNTISLTSIDLDIIEKFSQILFSKSRIDSHEIEHDSGTKSTYHTVYAQSNKLHDDLVKLGCTPCKSFTIRFNKDIVKPELIRHFIRGYFDGDGCICLTSDSHPVVDITSNKDFINDLLDFLRVELDMEFNKIGQRRKDTDTRNIQITSFDNVKKFLDYIYKDATVYMDRKFGYYNNFLSLYARKNMRYSTNIDQYGTNYIPIYNNNVLNAKYIKTTSKEEKKDICEFVFNFYKSNGFPYPILTDDELIQKFNTLKRLDVETILLEEKVLNIYNTSGLDVVKHFSPHIFEVKSGFEPDRFSMLESYHDDDCFRKIIMNRLEDDFQINGNMIRQGMANSSLAFKGSLFIPSVAKYLYSKFAPEENDIIYDYSCGFGQRLLAALSLPHKVKYIGVDPFSKSVDSNRDIFNFYNKHIPTLNKECEIVCDGSENYCNPKYINKVKVAFSSPAYYNQEVYENNPSQAYINRDYKSFINDWWKETAKNIYSLLRDDGRFLLNIKDEVDGFFLSDDMNAIAKQVGFKLVDKYNIRLTRNVVFRNSTGQHKHEPIYVFSK